MAPPVALRKLLGSALLVLAVAACAGNRPKTDWHDTDSYRGWVTDAATGKPIEGAVVVAVWQIGRPRLSLEGGLDPRVIRLEETITDKEGRFEFAPLGDYSPPLGWERDKGRFPNLTFFKPGYEPMFRDRFDWEHELTSAGPLNNPATASPRKPGWEREVQLFRYLTRPMNPLLAGNPIFERMTPEQKIEEKLNNFASFLARNIENSDAPSAPDDSLRRGEAVQSEWRAILMIDEEIRKYKPNYWWYSSAIRNALRSRAGK